MDKYECIGMTLSDLRYDQPELTLNLALDLAESTCSSQGVPLSTPVEETGSSSGDAFAAFGIVLVAVVALVIIFTGAFMLIDDRGY